MSVRYHCDNYPANIEKLLSSKSHASTGLPDLANTSRSLLLFLNYKAFLIYIRTTDTCPSLLLWADGTPSGALANCNVSLQTPVCLPDDSISM